MFWDVARDLRAFRGIFGDLQSKFLTGFIPVCGDDNFPSQGYNLLESPFE
jgi:hypothetical protein